MKIILYSIFFIITAILTDLFFPRVAFGQTASFPPIVNNPSTEPDLGIATLIEIKDKEIRDGSIVSFTKEGYRLSDKAYDPTAYGIVTEFPAVTLEVPDQKVKNQYYVVKSGKAYVQVSTENGAIKPGDLLTTSKRKGIAQKATKEGYVIGTALEDYDTSNLNQTGKILVSLNFAFHSQSTELRTNLLENLNLVLNAPFLTPGNALRYVLAVLFVLISFALGMGYFGKVTRSGVEALGRNPLASHAILASVIINASLTLLTMAVGLGLAYLILVL
jgi:hypothetical protein